MKTSIYIKLVLSCFAALSACEELTEVSTPGTQLDSDLIFEDSLSAIATVSALYADSRLSANGTGFGGAYFMGALSADELIKHSFPSSDNVYPFYVNNIVPTNPVVGFIWNGAYKNIYLANAIIEKLPGVPTITPALKNQLLGEAIFMRAFFHFYLVNLFGNVPYIKTTNYLENNVVGRMPVAEVYQHIIADLVEAKNLLANTYKYSNNEKVRASKGVATAMLARVYLYTGAWAAAEAEASEVIANTALYSLPLDVNTIFLKNSAETIWQIITTNNYTPDGLIFTSSNPDITLTPALANAFEAGDKRRAGWVFTFTQAGQTRYSSRKYKAGISATSQTEYTMMLRLAEQYLIRAEARAKQERFTGAGSAAQDINTIRTRAGLPNTTAITESELIAAIEQERRVELMAEMGHRWFDLKRTDRANAVLGTKPNWNKEDVLYPLPEAETLINRNMRQNDGYND